MSREEAARDVAQIAREAMTEAEEQDSIGMIQRMTVACEEHDIPREERIDVIIDGVEMHLEQTKEQALRQFEDSLRRLSGL